MILLGMDTCASIGTLALARVGPAGGLESLGSAELPGRSAGAELVPALQEMLGQAGVELGAVSGLVVVDGPGSFTGIRIGLSTAKALAEARAIPLYAISRLRVLAATNRARRAALDAGRGEFYLGDLGVPDDLGDTQPCAPGEWLCTQQELAGLAASGAGELVACEAKVLEACGHARLVPAPTAADALRCASADLLAGCRTEVGSLDGRYLRRADPDRTLQPPRRGSR